MSSDPRYGTEVQRRLRETPGAGEFPPGPDVVVGRAGDREQGCEVQLFLRVADGRVADARFRAFGCPHVIATASWLTDHLRGAQAGGLMAWDWREAVAALEVPPAKFGRLLVVQDAVRAASRNWSGAPRSTV